MTKHNAHHRRLTAAILALLVLTGCVAVAPPASAQEAEVVPVSIPAAVSQTEVLQPQSETDSAADALQYMREEEKLARDVYLALYEQWGLPVFSNIARAESQHMSMVLQALDARGLTDPAAANDAGEFTNPDLQALYHQLVSSGSESVPAALKVGATIEDLDIADLQERLQSVTDEDVRFVFENLVRGSENHMRAFVRNLSRYGETYEPQYIDVAYFDSIVTGETATGPRADGASLGQFARSGQGRGGRWQR